VATLALAGLSSAEKSAYCPRVLDLLLRDCRLPTRPEPADLAIAGGRIVALGPAAGIARETIDADAATTLAFAVLYGTDPATNCVPSLHVSLALLGATSFWPERRRLAGACLGWATLIAVSTLTTKQHYAVDVVSGALVAAGAAWLTRCLEMGDPRRVPQAPSRPRLRFGAMGSSGSRVE